MRTINFIGNPQECINVKMKKIFFCHTTAIITVWWLYLQFFSSYPCSRVCLRVFIKRNFLASLCYVKFNVNFFLYEKLFIQRSTKKNKKQRLVPFMTCILPISLFFIHSILNKDFFYSKNDFTTFFLHSLVMLLAYHIKKRKLLSWKTRRQGR